MKCAVCPRSCGAERNKESGICSVGEYFKVARAAPHFWEEPFISGTKGSGTVFFSGCNLGCVFCQNYDVSHRAFGKEISDVQLMKIFDSLIEKGVHNINLVTPTHYAPMLAKVHLGKHGRIVCRGYKIDVVNAFFDKRIKDFHKLNITYFLAECTVAYIIILAKNTA